MKKVCSFVLPALILGCAAVIVAGFITPLPQWLMITAGVAFLGFCGMGLFFGCVKER